MNYIAINKLLNWGQEYDKIMHLTETRNTGIARCWVHCKHRHKRDVTPPVGVERIYKHLPSPNIGSCFSITANAQAEQKAIITSNNLHGM